MRYYEDSYWGLGMAFSLRASVLPRAFMMAVPNAGIAFFLGTVVDHLEVDQDVASRGFAVLVGFTSVLAYILYFRCSVAYDRWWEASTLLQQTRGEWFNCYSSLIAMTATDATKGSEVEKFEHTLARLMSLLFCRALQQVSPDRNRSFEVIDYTCFDKDSLHFLEESSDKVEVLRQWIQRLMVLNMESGVIPIPAPVITRAFQELSRGVVHLQNARKIAEFPFPFPYAQLSVTLLLLHWLISVAVTSLLFPKEMAAAASFIVVFCVWCAHHLALELERPFGEGPNHVPMQQMQQEWNQSLGTLLLRRAQMPPPFDFRPEQHRMLLTVSLGTKNKPRHTIRLPSPDIRNGEVLGLARGGSSHSSLQRVVKRTMSFVSGSIGSGVLSNQASALTLGAGPMSRASSISSGSGRHTMGHNDAMSHMEVLWQSSIKEESSLHTSGQIRSGSSNPEGSTATAGSADGMQLRPFAPQGSGDSESGTCGGSESATSPLPPALAEANPRRRQRSDKRTQVSGDSPTIVIVDTDGAVLPLPAACDDHAVGGEKGLQLPMTTVESSSGRADQIVSEMAL